MPLDVQSHPVLSGRARLYFLEEEAAPPDHEWLALLSVAECVRLSRMTSAGRRRSFIVARGLLRSIVGDLLGADPAAVPLALTPQGGVAVAGAPMAVSLSHSGGRVMAGVAEGAAALGVDIEMVREDVDYRRVAARMLPPEDGAAIAAAPLPRVEFFKRWCLFEARHKLGPHDATQTTEESGLLDGDYAYAVCLLTKASPLIRG